MGAAQCRLGLWAEATHSLEEALSKGPEGADDLHSALDQLQVRGGQVESRPAPSPGRCWAHSPQSRPPKTNSVR